MFNEAVKFHQRFRWVDDGVPAFSLALQTKKEVPLSSPMKARKVEVKVQKEEVDIPTMQRGLRMLRQSQRYFTARLLMVSHTVFPCMNSSLNNFAKWVGSGSACSKTISAGMLTSCGVHAN